MKFYFLRIIFVFNNIIFPPKFALSVNHRVERMHNALIGTKELKLFWSVVLYPLKLAISLIIALLKVFFIWLLPEKTFFNLRYVLKQIYTDLCVNHSGLKTSLKRGGLCWELLTKGAEKHTSFGEENPNKTFYVIRPYYFLQPNAFIFRNVANLLTQYYYCLQKLSYAIENNWIPVVDWQNYGQLPHAEDYPVNGTTNSWEYYWQQPSEYTLEEVYHSKNVILSTQNIGQYGYIPNASMAPPYSEYAYQLAEKCPRYAATIPLNQTTQAYVDKSYDELFPKGKKVLGVVVRGSAYGKNATPLRSHPKQIDIKNLIKETEKYLELWEMDCIFFVNEIQEMVDEMKEAFGDRMICLPRERDHIDRPTDGITKNPLYADGRRYQTNLDYVTEVALLSRCDSLIGSMSSGARTALIWNAQKYEHIYMFEKGLW